MQEQLPVLLRVPEVAASLGVRPARVYALIANGTIPAVRLGRQIRISKHAIESFVDQGGKPLSGGWREDSAA